MLAKQVCMCFLNRITITLFTTQHSSRGLHLPASELLHSQTLRTEMHKLMLLRLQTTAQLMNAALFPHTVDTGWTGINVASKM